jgi:hypothetical protein
LECTTPEGDERRRVDLARLRSQTGRRADYARKVHAHARSIELRWAASRAARRSEEATVRHARDDPVGSAALPGCVAITPTDVLAGASASSRRT